MQSKLAKTGTTDIRKLPPMALEVEETVLGSCIMEPDILHVVIGLITTSCFYKEKHQLIWESLKRLLERGRPIDTMILHDDLKLAGDLEIVGGLQTIMFLTQQIDSVRNIEAHCEILKEKRLGRNLIQYGSFIIQSAYDETAEVGKVLEHSQLKLSKLVNNTFQSKQKGSKELIQEMKDFMLKARANNDAGNLSGVPTGLTLLDKATGGWHNSNLIIVAGRPGAGKTAFTKACIKGAIGGAKKPVGMFSLEMSTVELTTRIFSEYLTMPSNIMMKGAFKDSLWDHVDEHSENLIHDGKDMLFIEDRAALTINEVSAIARKWDAEHDCCLYIIDYLQLMRGGGKYGNREAEVSDISRGLKKLAKDLKKPVIALSQLSRDVEKRGGNHRPKLSDLRESGCLTGDTLIMCMDLQKMVPIKDLVDKKFRVLSTDKESLWSSGSKKCWKTGHQQVYEITLSNGFKIKATGNHKFLTEHHWTSIDDMTGKERLALPINYAAEIEGSMSESECIFLGLMIANGSTVARQPVRFTSNSLDLDLCEALVRHAKKCTSNGVIGRIEREPRLNKNCNNVFFKSRKPVTHGVRNPINVLMDKHGLFDKRSHDKFVPEEMFFQSHDKICKFLSAMFACDGTAYYDHVGNRKRLCISYSSASHDLIVGVQSLLLSIGVVSMVKRLENKKGQVWYNLSISSNRNLSLYVEKVGFMSKRKQTTMMNAWKKVKGNKVGWVKYSINKSDTLCYLPIKEIKKLGKEDVYDIEVPGDHCFTANGIIAHNSIEQDADVVMFLYRPWYYWQQLHETKYRFIKKEDPDGEMQEFESKDFAEIILSKNRNGGVADLVTGFTQHLTMFHDAVYPWDKPTDIPDSDLPF